MRYSTKKEYLEYDLLGKGAFSEVLKVNYNGTDYALKRIYNDSLRDPTYSEIVYREISIMKKLNHPGIVQLYDVFQGENQLQLLLEYVSGGTLWDQLKVYDKIPEEIVKGYIKDIIEVLKYLHKFQEPILHRDIKPENILLDKNGRVKLCDFGSANMIVDHAKRYSYVGTDDYMAPQMKQSLAHDQSLDVWCVGILLYELLVGQTPNLQKMTFPNYISRPVEDLIKRILVKQPQKRIKLEEICEHIWLSDENIDIDLSQFSLGLENDESELEILALVSEKNLQINKKYSKSMSTNEKQLNPEFSDFKEVDDVDEKVESYMKDLKEKLVLISTIENNQRKIQQLKVIKEAKKQEENQQIQLFDEKIKQFKNNIKILSQKQQKKNQQALSKIGQLLYTLEDIEEIAKTIPSKTENQILTFQDPQVEIKKLPISEYIPKLKIQILKRRKNLLKELKMILKRKKNMSYMMPVENSLASSESYADASFEDFLK